MSRAYRVAVSESVSTVIRTEDSVQSRLEILEILPCDEMAEILSTELEKDGFQREGETMVKKEGDVEITVETKTGRVTAKAETSKQVKIDVKAESYINERGWGGESQKQFDDRVGSKKEELEKQLQKQIEQKEEINRAELQKKSTEALEASLRDTQRELNQAVNRATAEALKRRAAQLGEIKEISEEQDGSMTIKVEV